MSIVTQKEHLIEPHAGDDKGAGSGQAFGGTSLEVTGLDNPLKKQLDGFAAIGIRLVLPCLQRRGQLLGRKQLAPMPGIERAVRQGADVVSPRVRQHLALDGLLELGYKADGRYVTVPPPGSVPSAVASDCSHRWPGFSLLVEARHDIRSLFNRDKRVGPVYLIEVDVTGLQAPQRVSDLPQQPGAGVIADHLAVSPLEPRLRSEDNFVALAYAATALPTISSKRPRMASRVIHVDCT